MHWKKIFGSRPISTTLVDTGFPPSTKLRRNSKVTLCKLFQTDPYWFRSFLVMTCRIGVRSHSFKLFWLTMHGPVRNSEIVVSNLEIGSNFCGISKISASLPKCNYILEEAVKLWNKSLYRSLSRHWLDPGLMYLMVLSIDNRSKGITIWPSISLNSKQLSLHKFAKK
jgi:hypothetical protein